MTSTRSRFAFTVALVVSACADAPGDLTGPDLRVETPNLPAELPTIPSGPLHYFHHSGMARAASSAFSASSGPRTIAQKVLLLSPSADEAAYTAAKDALDRIGIPYTSVFTIPTTITDAMLTDGVSTCYYSAVLISNSGLAYDDPSLGWVSSLSATEWASLANFETSCGAREAVWYAYPGPEFGMNWPSATFSYTDTHVGIVANASILRRVPASAQIPYRNVYGYLATIGDAANVTPIVQDSSGYTLVATYHRADGTDVLFSTVDSNPWVPHAWTLEHDMLRWLTKNMFVGQKKAYLGPQVDDLFIDGDVWNSGDTFRITGADLTSFVAWQTAFRASLPAGSTYITTMAFNGWGAASGEYSDTTLFSAARAAGTSLVWLNHTWDHENMDGMSRKTAKNEVARDCNFAKTYRLNGFTCADLVTPDMSGLSTRSAVLGMLEAGVRYVESDTSYVSGNNPSFNVGLVSSIDSRMYMNPRHPTNIYYNVHTPALETSEYNFLYHSYWGRDLTYPEVIDKSSEFSAQYLLTGDIDTLMFHQENLADYDGQQHSLLGDLISAGAAKYLALQNAPILTLSQSAVGQAMKDRNALNTCSLTANVYDTGTTRTLQLSSSSPCKVPVTGLNAPSYGSVEQYAGDAITTVSLPGGTTVSIPLP